MTRLIKKLEYYSLDKEYEIVSTSTCVVFKHLTCGEIFNSKESYFFDKKRRCLKCTISKDTNGEFRVIRKIPDDDRSNYEIEHVKCGTIFKRTYSEYERRGCRCPKCSTFTHYTDESFKKTVSTLDKEYEVRSKFKTCMDNVVFYHTACDSEFEMRPSHFLDGRRCPICKNKAFGMSNEYFKSEISYLFDNNIELVDDFSGSFKPIRFIHVPCGHVFSRKPNDLLTSGKKKCFRCENCEKISHGEYLIEEFLKSNNIEYKTQYRLDGCVNDRILKFDFAIFKNNNLSLLIEFDGRQHEFGFNNNSESLSKIQKNDKIKNDYCKDNNILLYRISYKNIINTQDIVKNILIENNLFNDYPIGGEIPQQE
jgi:hypothetical protein